MKFIHLSDLHLGKRIREFSMIEDQRYILKKILNLVDEQKPDALLLAGDIYDKPVPSAEAVELLDDFLVRLSQRSVPVFLISGNHDSAGRLAFGGRLMKHSGIHLSPVYQGNVEPLELEDEYGVVRIYLLPFLKPAEVRRYFPEQEISGYTDAVRTAVEAMHIDTAGRNILVTHQFVTGALRSESEDISVGGSDNVDASVFDCFDYVALGHIHGPQNIGSPRIRYCGTPLKYSFSEASHRKSATIVELLEKGSLKVTEAPLIPLRDMVELRGSYEEVTLRSFYEKTAWQEDYVHVTLTDEEDIPDAAAKLRTIYHGFMKLDYDNVRTRHSAEICGASDVESRSPLELFAELYQLQNGTSMSAEQTEYMVHLMEEIWEEHK